MRIFDALPADDHNSMAERYTVLVDDRHFLGMSIGGRAVSQWGELPTGGDVSALGREIQMHDLDADTQGHIRLRLSA